MGAGWDPAGRGARLQTRVAFWPGLPLRGREPVPRVPRYSQPHLGVAPGGELLPLKFLPFWGSAGLEVGLGHQPWLLPESSFHRTVPHSLKVRANILSPLRKLLNLRSL